MMVSILDAVTKIHGRNSLWEECLPHGKDGPVEDRHGCGGMKRLVAPSLQSGSRETDIDA